MDHGVKATSAGENKSGSVAEFQLGRALVRLRFERALVGLSSFIVDFFSSSRALVGLFSSSRALVGLFFEQSSFSRTFFRTFELEVEFWSSFGRAFVELLPSLGGLSPPSKGA